MRIYGNKRGINMTPWCITIPHKSDVRHEIRDARCAIADLAACAGLQTEVFYQRPGRCFIVAIRALSDVLITRPASKRPDRRLLMLHLASRIASYWHANSFPIGKRNCHEYHYKKSARMARLYRCGITHRLPMGTWIF